MYNGGMSLPRRSSRAWTLHGASVAPRRAQLRTPVHLVVRGDALKTILEKVERHLDVVLGEIHSSHTVLIKINANSSNPFPASTSPEMLMSIIRLLRKRGVHRIVVGDCTSLTCLPTRKVFADLGLPERIGTSARLQAFDEGRWTRLQLDGRYLKNVLISRTALEVDRIINLANVKTHVLADFALGIKNLVGLTHPRDRKPLHRDHLQEKIAELVHAVEPDLTIIDARSMFVSGGPNKGTVRTGDRVLLGTDILASEVQAYEYLRSQCVAHAVPCTLADDPSEMRMFRCFTAEELRHARAVVWEQL